MPLQYRYKASDGVNVVTPSFYQTTATSDLIDALYTAMNGGLISYQVTEQFGYAGGVPDNPVVRAARLNFETTKGLPYVILIPGLADSAYLGGSSVVDPDNAYVANVIGATISVACTKSGIAIAGYAGGYRVQLPQSPIQRYR